MFAESIHSLADTLNQSLLLIGLKRSKKPADQWTEADIRNWNFATNNAPRPGGATTAPAADATALTTTQKTELDAAAARVTAGTASQTDKDNLAYARQRFGYGSAPLVSGSAESGIAATSDQARQAEADAVAQAEAAKIAAATTQDGQIQDLTKQKTIADLKQSLGIGEAPKIPNFADTYTALRTSYGLTDLEGQMTSLDKQIADVVASLNMGIRDESGKLRPMELITGRQSALRGQAQDTLDQLNAAKAALTSEYATKSNVISSIMGFTEKDYAAASDQYNNDFSHAVQMQQLLNSDRTAEQNQANVESDNARANMQVVVNAMKDSGKSWGSIDAATRTQIEVVPEIYTGR